MSDNNLPLTTPPTFYARIDEIGFRMKMAGIAATFVESVMETAKEYEGMYDFMVLWDEEKTKEERDLILSDITRTLTDIQKYK